MRIRFHPGTEAWIPSASDLGRIGAWFDPKLPEQATVEIVPRADVVRATGIEKPPWTFRAVTRDGVSWVLVDGTEDPKSVAFLIAHEACHQVVAVSPTVHAALAEARPRGVPRTSDLFHEDDPEEKFCDGIAANLLGYRRDRSWWRRRLAEMRIRVPPQAEG